MRPVRPGHRGGSSRGHSGCMRIFAHFNIEPCVAAHPNRSVICRRGGWAYIALQCNPKGNCEAFKTRSASWGQGPHSRIRSASLGAVALHGLGELGVASHGLGPLPLPYPHAEPPPRWPGVAHEPHTPLPCPQAPHSLTSGRPGRPVTLIRPVRPRPTEMDELPRSLWTT